MTPSIKLIYFRDCPHVPKVKQLLFKNNLTFEEICQDSLPEGSPYREYSSPTILIDHQIVLGGRIPSGSCACSVIDAPNFDAETELQRVLSQRVLAKI